MGRETRRQPEGLLTEADRVRIAEAREVLKFYGQDTHPDTPEPLTELGYEQRMARGRAAEIAVAAIATGHVQFGSISKLAGSIYDFIWEGRR